MTIDNDVLRILRQLRQVAFARAEITTENVSIVIDGTRPMLQRDGVGRPSPKPVRADPSSAKIAGRAVSLHPDDPVTVAPLMGTFYRAPKPGAPPFVEPGQEVEAGSVVGLIEVMKLMNSVFAGRAGRIAEFTVRDGQLVERGQALLRFVRSPAT